MIVGGLTRALHKTGHTGRDRRVAGGRPANGHRIRQQGRHVRQNQQVNLPQVSDTRRTHVPPA
jgi:hypothetical protein